MLIHKTCSDEENALLYPNHRKYRADDVHRRKIHSVQQVLLRDKQFIAKLAKVIKQAA